MPQVNGYVQSPLDGLLEQLTLHLACSKCSLQVNESTYQLAEQPPHCCPKELLLARCKGTQGKLWRKVGRRPIFPNPAQYDVCRYYVPGRGCTKHRNQCTFAWSQEEVIVWTYERKHNMGRQLLKMLLWRELSSSLSSQFPPKPLDHSVSEDILSEFGGRFQEICKTCFYRTPQKICPRDSAWACRGHWSPLLAHVVTNGTRKEQYTEIRPCPGAVKLFSYCRPVSAGEPCKHTVDRCVFAHSDVELAVWEAEQHGGLARGDLLRSQGDGQAGEEASQPGVRFYCRVCLVTCSSQESFENHCSSVEHRQLITTNCLVQWTYRTPPYDPKALVLCSRAEACDYGQDCAKAHSIEELEEWIQRVKLAEESRKSARQGGLLAYQDRLLAEYQESYNEVLIISQELEGVVVTCQQPLKVFSEDKKMRYQWIFTVHSQKQLEHVALLKKVPGASFSLGDEGSQGLTYASGKRFRTLPTLQRATVVEVHVECHAFGVYEQWVVFDFGSRPVLLRKLQVRVGPREAPWLTSAAAEQGGQLVDFERWHRGNRVVVPGVERTAKELELLARYKAPGNALEFHCSAAKKLLGRLNYRLQMHNFLFREEEAQQTLISRLNLQVVALLQQMTETLSMGMKIAPPGMLYAHIPTPDSLTPDSKEGFLLFRSVKTAFLAPDPPLNNRVFEVSVDSKDITERSVWLLLPPLCCFELGLAAGMSLKVEVQFQVDQLQFREWHLAADRLCDERLVLPDVAACSVPQPPWQVPRLPWGNAKQQQAVSFITGQAAGVRQVPPLLIYGPFGTGKTFTLAMSTLEIIKQPKTRVLICTHTNSAADIYICEYFHEYVTSGHPEAAPLRIKYPGQDVHKTDPVTLPYCCLSPNRDSFRLPSKEELDRHRIVITTSMLSVKLGLSPGYFSHILIDEAAQMLECEALVPLSLATLETRIILAGDHMQVTPTVFSLQEGEQLADYTLLNRLFQYYKKEKHEAAVKFRTIFNENYRSTAGIISFVSRHFYVGKGDAIHARGNVPPHPEFHPLMFCHVDGLAERHHTVPSWFNSSEAGQVVEKVEEMIQRWPAEWGVRDPKKICVVSCGVQVKTIRQQLRKKHLGEVMVENHENLPGRAFRVIIISTVHTRESLGHVASSNLDFFNNARVLNTILTRAQSQVIAVGDVVALCSHGQCSKIWKGFVKECIEMKAVAPETLTLEEIRQVACNQAIWTRGSPELEEEESDTDSWFSDVESMNIDDPILQELLDESKEMVVMVSDEGILNVKPEVSTPQSSGQKYVNYSSQTMEEYLRMQPNTYKRCELLKEGFYHASAFTLDDDPPMTIQVKGQLHCGMAFSGDEVLVQILQPSSGSAMTEGSPHGKVVGVLKKAERISTFVCSVDEFDLRIMIPIDRTVTKIFVPGLKDRPNIIPIRKIEGNHRITGCKEITQENRKKWLFAVQIIKWQEGYYYPLGIVTDVLPAASTLEEGLRILDIEFGLTNEYPAQVNHAVAALTSSKFPPKKDERKDCRSYRTFTVDPQGARDLDDAISVRDLGSEYEIGIHIADIASMVPKGGAIDSEAKKRGATYYMPGKVPVGMIPPQLSQDFCSLLPQKERWVISLFVLVDKETDQMTRVSFTLSTIVSDRQLTYEEAEGIIRNYYSLEAPLLNFDTLEDCVAAAYHFSRVHRVSRLHEDSYYDQLDEDSLLGQRCSHQMIKELMIMFNSAVAEFLTTEHPTRNLTPLRCQKEPNPHQVKQIREKSRDIIPLSTHLSHHLGPVSPRVHMQATDSFAVLTSLWDHLRSAVDAWDIPKILDLIMTDDVHPMLAPVNLEFRKLLPRSFFLRSNSSDQSKVGHYSLHVNSYTWASSPIRRYIDIVLQRHLLSVILNKAVEYFPAEIESLCHDFNRKNSMASACEKRARSLETAAQLTYRSQQKVAFVMNVEEMAKNFVVLFPLDRDSLSDPHLINYRALQLVTQPSFNQEQKSVQLMWRRRFYSTESLKECTAKVAVLRDQRISHFTFRAWRDVLAATRKKDYKEVVSLLEKSYCAQGRTLARMQRSQCAHYVELSVELRAGDVLYLQLATDFQRGFLVPSVQLWAIGPGFDVCLEHAERPVDCFSEYTTQASKKTYKNVSDYRKVWLPLCAMEAASCAVAENDSIVVRDVEIVWKKQRTKNGQLQGTFSFSKEFLKLCAIRVDFSCCYLCIRLSGLRFEGVQSNVEVLSHSLKQLSLGKENTETSKFMGNPTTYTWVAHGCTTEGGDSEKADQRDQKMVNFYINFTSMKNIPVELTQASSRFTVELIPKLLPDIRTERAIENLQNANALVQAIALRQKIPVTGKKFSEHWTRTSFDLPGSSRKLNPSQNQAIAKALKEPFSVIQGPPEMLMHMVDSPRPLRVYGESTEWTEYPFPGSSLTISRKSQRDTKSKPEIRTITLHHRIRQPSNPFSGRICAFDDRVRRGEEITDKEVEKYIELLRKARRHELERHDVILCTCSASCSPSLTKALNVKQVLIDECAMCTEPETLIPMVNYRKAEKVVFLGDHMQLRPVVHNELTRTLGMQQSLFEQYKNRAHMLNIQYRMHREICAFPSKAFYDGKLQTCRLVCRSSILSHRQRPFCPILFGHIEGKEKSLMVSTEEGNESSQANMEEANEVVRIAQQLTRAGLNKPEQIAILTPYNAQVMEIKKLLSQKKLPHVTVCTIMKSQGSEWKYVIVSTVRSCSHLEIEKKPLRSWMRKHLGTVADPNQINVALTRAQDGLCIIGNSHLLECNSLWRNLLQHYRKEQCYTAAAAIRIEPRLA
ncbi:helicase with zinc finger domain 2 isoform X2 [Varanus komodoensis]|uniref:helicase with zinc finger domain 2 isoform X2 n=1 Tax=Varanus komodoensis TaxID=61221 RepID=UPI001CF7BACA|nr:helicase with zinc finger domain 2 isoform X2 [Varanus komodoensis]